jgi:hypothetical protein
VNRVFGVRLKPDTHTAASAGDNVPVVGPENKGIVGAEGEVVRDSGGLVDIVASRARECKSFTYTVTVPCVGSFIFITENES